MDCINRINSVCLLTPCSRVKQKYPSADSRSSRLKHDAMMALRYRIAGTVLAK
jgi:hypothetical protein